MSPKKRVAGRGGSRKAAIRPEPVSDREIGIRLKELRGKFLAQLTARMERRGVSRSELAARLGVSRVFVTQLFTGGANPTLRTLAAVTLALDCDMDIEVKRRRPAYLREPGCHPAPSRRGDGK